MIILNYYRELKSKNERTSERMNKINVSVIKTNALQKTYALQKT